MVHVIVRQALFALAAEQLARLAAAVGVAFSPPTEGFPTPDAALAILDEEQRPFDAARVRLWRAEAGEPNAGLDEAVATFEDLGAHPYLERARAVGQAFEGRRLKLSAVISLVIYSLSEREACQRRSVRRSAGVPLIRALRRIGRVAPGDRPDHRAPRRSAHRPMPTARCTAPRSAPAASGAPSAHGPGPQASRRSAGRPTGRDGRGSGSSLLGFTPPPYRRIGACAISWPERSASVPTRAMTRKSAFARSCC